MAEHVWNLARDNRSTTTFRWVAVEYERKRNGCYRWRKVREIGRPCAKWAATANGEESGLPRDESAVHNEPAWRLSDYIDADTQAAARLGGCKIALLARSNKQTWSSAICIKHPGCGWCVVVHLGARRMNSAVIANTMGLRVIFAHTLSRVAGAIVQTQDDFVAAVEAKQKVAERARLAPARRKKNRKKWVAKARAAGDTDEAARILTGKSKAKRTRAAKRAAKTRKRNVRVFNRRSKAAKKAAKTRKANAEKKAAEHTRRSAAAKLAWAARKIATKCT